MSNSFPSLAETILFITDVLLVDPEATGELLDGHGVQIEEVVDSLCHLH
jgi:hypothetical protein